MPRAHMVTPVTMASMQAEQAELEALIVTFRLTRAKTYSITAALCVLFYDLILNLHSEIEHIWMAAWSVPKVLYIIARYYSIVHISVMLAFGIAVDLSDAESVLMCKAWSWVYNLGGLVVFTSLVNIILFLRIDAIYSKKKKVLIPLAFLMICQFGFEMTTITWNAIVYKRIDAPAFIPWPGCLAEYLGHQTLIAWVPCIFVAFVCAALTVHRFLVVSGVSWSKKSPIRTSPLFKQFVLDGTLGFVLIFAVNLTTAILTIKVRNPLADVTTTWLVATYSMAGVKMIMNLRISNTRTLVDSQNFDTSLYNTETAPRFATSPNTGHHTVDSIEMMSFAEPSASSSTTRGDSDRG